MLSKECVDFVKLYADTLLKYGCPENINEIILSNNELLNEMKYHFNKTFIKIPLKDVYYYLDNNTVGYEFDCHKCGENLKYFNFPLEKIETLLDSKIYCNNCGQCYIFENS